MIATRERLATLAFLSVTAIAALVCLACFARMAALAGQHVPLDPNEGWNAYHTLAAMAGRGPYPSADSFMSNNYPPLSFYMVGLVGAFLGDHIVAGRIVSLAAFLFVCGGICLAARRMGCTMTQAAFAPLYFAAFLLLESDYVGMDDPQMLGHALDIAGLLLLLPAATRTRAIMCSAALFVLAGFVKHNLFVLPVAAALWLAFYERRRALLFAATGLLLSLLGLGLFRLACGFDLLARLNSPRLYSFGQFQTQLAAWLWPAALPLLASLMLAFRFRHDRFAVLCALYVVLAFFAGAFFLGGAGVDVNAMFDCDIALALCGALAANRGHGIASSHAAFAPFAIALVFFAPLAADAARNTEEDWRTAAFWFAPMQDEIALAKADIAFLRARKGPALCEMLALCYWAGKPAEVDVFNLDQQLRTGARDARPFIHLLDAHYYRAVQFDALSPFPLPPAVQAAFARNYRVDHVNDEGAFLVAR